MTLSDLRTRSLLACCAAFSFGVALAGHARADSASNPDQTFADKAATGGLAEVEMGKLAQKHAQGTEAKQFGKKMVTDHSKANAELKTLAKKKGMTLPTKLTPEQQATYDGLAKLNGAEFDTAYMKDMQKDHDEDVAEFKKEADNGQDPDLKKWAGKTLPVLQTHDEMAHQYSAK